MTYNGYFERQSDDPPDEVGSWGKDDYTMVEVVNPGFACPQCGEDTMDLLVWISDDAVRCGTCGKMYDPEENGVEA